MDLRLATPDDARKLFEWRNDDLTRENSHNTDMVNWESHLRWVDASLARQDRKILIAIEGACDIGTIRLDYADTHVELSWTISPSFRRLGFGQKLIDAGYLMEPERKLIAQIKSNNLPSLKIAERAGFKRESFNGNVIVLSRLPLVVSGINVAPG